MGVVDFVGSSRIGGVGQLVVAASNTQLNTNYAWIMAHKESVN